MNDLQFYSAVVGLVLPLLTAIVIQRGWSNQLKIMANAFLAFVGAVVVTYTQGNLDGDHLRQLFQSFLIVFLPALVMYLGVWKPSAIAPKIEAATGGDPDGSRDPGLG